MRFIVAKKEWVMGWGPLAIREEIKKEKMKNPRAENWVELGVRITARE